MPNNLESILSKIVKYGLYAVLLTPLAFWPRALFAFMTPKFIFFQVLVEIIFVSWLILKCWKPSFQHLKSEFNNWLVIALALFIVVSFISAIFGVDFSRSFWGIGARMTGIFAELHFFAWFLVLFGYFRGEKEKLFHYINFSFLVSILLALSAFYENTSWHLVYGSTLFNNPTFVGPYFIFHFFWGLYQVTNYKYLISNLKSWFFRAGTALLVFVIFLGQIRGIILGVFVGFLFFGLGLIFTDIVSRRLKIFIFTSLILIFMGLTGLWLERESSFIQNTSVLKRLTQVSLSQTTVQTRFFAWRAAFQGFKERPILGVGPENFNYIFNAHYNPSLLKYGFGETWFDKPHNAFLEILTEAGIAGAFFYISILVAVFLSLNKLFKSGQKLLSLSLLSALASYFTAMFFSFDSFGSWFGLFLFLALIALHGNSSDITKKYSNNTNNGFGIMFGLLGTILLLGLIYVNYGIWRANIADADALRVFSSSPSQGIELFKKSLRYKTPYKAEYQFDLFASVVGAVSKNIPIPNLEKNINLVLEEGEMAAVSHPNNAAYYTDMVKLYNILAEKGRDPQIISWAEIYGKKSLELSPNRQETLYYLGRTALLKGDTKNAVALTKDAVSVEPSINVSHWYYGLALIANNQIGEGKIEIEKALELGYGPQNVTEKAFIDNLGL